MIRRDRVIYRLKLDGVVCYVGRGLRTRPWEHPAEVAARFAGHGHGAQPKLYNALVAAVAAGSLLEVEVIVWGLTHVEAQQAEVEEIARWPEEQLLNETRAELKARMVRQNERLNADPEFKAKQRATMTRLHTDPKFRAGHLAALARLHADPEFKERRQIRLARLSNSQRGNPDHGARVSAGLSAAKESK